MAAARRMSAHPMVNALLVHHHRQVAVDLRFELRGIHDLLVSLPRDPKGFAYLVTNRF